MKAMILAAGRGVRMGALTDHTPKVMLFVRGKPLIHHHLHRLAQAGVRDVVINLAYLGEKIQESVGNGEAFGVSVQYSQEPPVGTLDTAGGIAHALPLLGDEPFLVVSGDIWTDFPFETVLSKRTDSAHIVLVDNPSHHPEGDFFEKNNRLVEVGEKRFTYGNIGVYSPTLFEQLPSRCYGLGDLIRGLIPQDLVSSSLYRGIWSDVGTPERLSLLNQENLTIV